jgi:hypothetical protein
VAKEPIKLIDFGPWKLGQNTVQPQNDAVFQVPNPDSLFPQDTIPQVLKASNLVFDNDGVPTRRSGLTQIDTVTSGLNLFAGAGLLLGQDQGTIFSIDTITFATTNLVTGLDPNLKVFFYDYLDQIWWSNGTTQGRILSNGTATNWGCSVAPSPTLSTTTGTLSAGRYMVACTFVDAYGIEHGAPKASVITMDGTKSIRVELSSVDTNASYINIYVTRPNGRELYFTKQVASTALPAVITDVSYSKEPLRTMGLSPPPAPDIIFSYRGFLMLGIDNFVFPSQGVNHHLFDLKTDLFGFETNLKAGAGLNNGFWVTTEKGAFWTNGDAPSEWELVKVDNLKYAKGALVIPGYLLPAANTPDPVALFVNEYGLVAGLPAGNILPLTKDRLHMDVEDKEASIVMNTQNEYNQLMFSVN